jgi:hypothetical protein
MPGPETFSYDCNQLTCTVGTALIDSGFAPDDIITVEPNDDDWKVIEGADGSVGFAKTNSHLGKVTIRLLQGSAKNDLLSAIRLLDQATPGGLLVPFYLNDRGGRSLYTGTKCRIMAPPKNVTFANELKTREWLIYVVQMKRFDGGN